MDAISKSIEPTNDELVKAREELETWQTPVQFDRKVRSLAQRVPSTTLFNKPNVGFLLDAIPLAEFARQKGVERVRLANANEQWPDGMIDAPFVNIEITEVLEEGRRRGQEYAKFGSAKADGNYNDWLARARAIPTRLEEAIKKKIDKKYATPPLLLIYLNISTYGLMHREIEAAINSLKEKHAASFHEICVMWHDKLY